MSNVVSSITPNSDPVIEHPGQVIVTDPPRRERRAVGLAVLGFIVVSLLVVAVLLYLFAVLGAAALLYAAILAAIPLIIVLLGIRWIDRWEPEPRAVLLFAFLWGAAAAVFIALVFSGITQAYVASHGIGKSGADFFESVVQAPIIEESAKGIGILLIFLVVRKYFDGPIDGIVYGATIAVGFAFTENLQYFGLAIVDHSGVGQTFLLRAVLSPFAHVMFTSCTGLAIGLAARHSNRIGVFAYFIAGLIPAMLLHAFWNSATYWATDWYLFYFLVEVPLFVLAIIGVVRLRRHEQGITQARLAEYAAVGWFTPSEVNQLSTPAGRRQVVAWAKSHGFRRQYRRFVQDATHLAFTRQRLISGKDRIGARRYEADLLVAVVADRKQLVGLPPLLTVVTPTR